MGSHTRAAVRASSYPRAALSAPRCPARTVNTHNTHTHTSNRDFTTSHHHFTPTPHMHTHSRSGHPVSSIAQRHHGGTLGKCEQVDGTPDRHATDSVTVTAAVAIGTTPTTWCNDAKQHQQQKASATDPSGARAQQDSPQTPRSPAQRIGPASSKLRESCAHSRRGAVCPRRKTGISQRHQSA